MRFLLTLFLFLALAAHTFAQNWQTLNSRALALYEQGDFDKARKIWIKSLNVARKDFGTSSEQYLHNINNLAFTNQELGDYEKAFSYFNQVKALSSEHFGDTHIEHIQCLTNLSNLFIKTAQ
ncbi:MAG: tetratricopeptide repeat protein [Bacteroidota bacterium]